MGGEVQGPRRFIGIGGYKKGVSSKSKGFLLERCIGRGVQQKDLSIFSEIRGIL
jgi:hypothetical protein